MADQDVPSKSWGAALWDTLMAHKSLLQAAGQEPPPEPMKNQDTSMVAKAAADAGARMEAEKKRQSDSMNRVKGPASR